MVFATHIINSWEEGEEVVFDVSTNPWDSLLTGGNLSLILRTRLLDKYDRGQPFFNPNDLSHLVPPSSGVDKDGN